MKCPQCEKEMVSGFMRFAKERGKFFAHNGAMIKNEPSYHKGVVYDYLVLTKNPAFVAVGLQCFYCTNCKFIITPIQDYNKNK